MNIKTIKSSLGTLAFLLGVAGYFILDWFEDRQKSHCETQRLKLVRLQESIKLSSVDVRESNQEALRFLEKNASVLLRFLDVLLRQDPHTLVFHGIKFGDQFLMVNGVTQSLDVITRVVTMLSSAVSVPVVIKSLSQSPNGSLTFELAAEMVG